MALKKSIKRIVTKSGEVRYYANGKRLNAKNGRRRFIKSNPSVPYSSLTESEVKALKASKIAKKGWKFKNLANIQPAYIELLKKFGVIDENSIPNNDLYYAYDQNGKRLFENFSDIIQYIDTQAKSNPLAFQWCNEVGLPNYRNRDYETFANNRLTSITDIVDLLNSPSYKRYNFIVTDTKGIRHSGRVDALLVLRDFEIATGSEIQSLVSNSAFMRFCYDYRVDFKGKTIEINLTDQRPKHRKGKKSVEKTIKWYVENSDGTASKQKIFIDDKFKDVEIEIDFS